MAEFKRDCGRWDKCMTPDSMQRLAGCGSGEDICDGYLPSDKPKTDKSTSQMIADVIIVPFNTMVDMVFHSEHDVIQLMEDTLDDMRKHTSMLAAFPHPASVTKSEERKAQDLYFKCIIDILKARKALRILQREQSKASAAEAEFLHGLGIST